MLDLELVLQFKFPTPPQGGQKLLSGRLPSRWWLKSGAAIALALSLGGCSFNISLGQAETPSPTSPSPRVTTPPVPSVTSSPVLADATANRDLLAESWDIYRQQFIQEDGRVIDYEASDRTVSEGQAYAMLRAVLINDPTTFDLTLSWAEDNLGRIDAKGTPVDQLWAWKWGKDKAGKWGPIDPNFASDADIDAITALILAARRWQRPDYLELARVKLRDLWKYSTIAVPGGKRYLLPGPKAAFVPAPSTVYLNPSYFAPYAFRLFAQVDPNHDWLSLVDSSYYALEQSAQTSKVGLPSDWIALDTKTGQFQPMPATSKLQSVYSFDAYRVWWRVAWDAAWFAAPEAERYLETATKHLLTTWRSTSRIPARIGLQGKPTVNYDTTSQYAMLYPALAIIDPDTAKAILDKKLLPRYNQGIWDDESAYYTQNLAWLGLFPPTAIDSQLLQP